MQLAHKKVVWIFSIQKEGFIKKEVCLKGEINLLVEFFTRNITLNEKSISYQTFSLVVGVITALIYSISMSTLCIFGEGLITFLKSY